MDPRRLFGIAVVMGVLLPAAAGAIEVWSGRTLVFTKPDSVDWMLPEHQDRLTDAVRLTRAHSRGLFNIAAEDSYTVQVSPQDTEWATGDAVDWPTLSFAPWQVWNGSFPPAMVGVDAVVHLISDDIYVDIRFDSWTSGNAGGGFSYARAVAPLDAVDDPPRAAAGLRATPNPFNPLTTLRFSHDATAHVHLALYDCRGRLVRSLVDDVRPAGTHAVRWDGRDDAGGAVAAGTYVARLRTGTDTSSALLTLVR